LLRRRASLRRLAGRRARPRDPGRALRQSAGRDGDAGAALLPRAALVHAGLHGLAAAAGPTRGRAGRCVTENEAPGEITTMTRTKTCLAALLAATMLAGPAIAAECIEVIGTEPAGVKVTMDPAFVNLADDSYQQNAVYNRLVNLDSDFQVIPELARSWSVSEDGMTWNFELEEGVTFHDGKPLTAKDVVYTYSRLLDPEVGSPAASVLGFLNA